MNILSTNNNNHAGFRSIGVLVLWGTLLINAGCKKFVDIDPPNNSITEGTTYASDATASSVVTGIYSGMMELGSGFDGARGISFRCATSADELTEYSNESIEQTVYKNNLITDEIGFWTVFFRQIYVANDVIEGIHASSAISEKMRNQLIGEATFIRAFMHFYGTALYGDFPIVTTTDYRINNTLSRSPRSEVFKQIIEDLKDAQNKLSTNYLGPDGLVVSEKIRPNKGVATALLARAYLYDSAWANAESAASAVINSPAAYDLENNLNKVFLANSSEAIWQLRPVVPGYNTLDGSAGILIAIPGSQGAPSSTALSNSLLKDFESGDQRLLNWVDTFIVATDTFYFPYKYKVGGLANTSRPVTEYNMVLRLAEQFLIRAEARAQQGNIEGAKEDLNTLRARAGLPETTANDKESILQAILHERRIELFMEWGHRWLDLQRSKTIDAVMTQEAIIKGSSWSSYKQLFPISGDEIQKNPHLKQTPGYH